MKLLQKIKSLFKGKKQGDTLVKRVTKAPIILRFHREDGSIITFYQDKSPTISQPTNAN